MSRVLMVASEATPFCKTGGLADVLGALPPELAARGEDVRVVLPAYRMNRYPGPVKEVWKNLWIPLGAGVLCDIYEYVERGVPFYFVDCPALYNRDGIYGDRFGDFGDNYFRYGVLCMAALGVARHLFRPDVIHCHDWQSALALLYLRENFGSDPTFRGIRTVYTIHNLGYQGEFSPDVLPWIGVDRRLFHPGQIEYFGRVNFMKAGIFFADAITTVSPRYAQEIQTAEYGFGLDGFLRAQNRLTGILNGVDYDEWNPQTDPHIAQRFNVDDLSGKRDCKRALLAEFGFPREAFDRPLIGIVSRFASQKGFDLISELGGVLLERDLTLIILGSGEKRFEETFDWLGRVRSDKVRVWIGYNNALAHRIEAGADMFLMPSLYEPSGLNQMYSLKYGTLPIVRATGGLDDTIEPGTGFKFWHYDSRSLMGAIDYALDAWKDQENWKLMMRTAMLKDFSWSASAARYSALYDRLLQG